jgi:hypothetical protein
MKPVLGIVLLGLGLLGFSPFLIALVYARAAWTALPRVGLPSRRYSLFLAGLILVLGIPGGIQRVSSQAFDRSLMEILSGDDVAAARGIERLRRWSFLVDLDQVIAAYVKEAEPVRQARLGAAYEQLTGQNAAGRAAELVD